MSIDVAPDLVGWVCQSTDNPSVQAALIGIALAESGGNPGAIGDYTTDCIHFYDAADAPPGSWPTSFGLLQDHNDAGGCPAGLGGSDTEAQLLDPLFNLGIGVAHIQAALNDGNTLYQALDPWSTRDIAWPQIQAILANGFLPACSPPPGPSLCPPGCEVCDAQGACVTITQVEGGGVLALIGLTIIGLAAYAVYKEAHL